jgi:hypothetical protein
VTPKSNPVAERSHQDHPGVFVLCEPNDESALWVAAGIQERMAGPVDVVTGPMLIGAGTWEHRIRGDVAEVEITLEDGRRISSLRPRPILNRMSVVSTPLFSAVASADRDYAVQEFHALFLSWLWAYPGLVLNRPSPQFLGGHWRTPAAWAVLAAKAGLPTAHYRYTSDDHPEDLHIPLPSAHRPVETVVVVAGQVLASPAVPTPLADACQRLAALSGDEVVGIDLARAGRGSWEFINASPSPSLLAGGERLLDVLVGVLLAAA